MAEKLEEIKTRIEEYRETHIVAFKGFDENEINEYIKDLEKIHDYLEEHPGYRAYRIAKHLGVRGTAIRRKLVLAIEIGLLRIDRETSKAEYYALEI